MNPNDYLQKAATVLDNMIPGGRMEPEQAARFIDLMVDQQVSLPLFDTYRNMKTDRRHLDALEIGTRSLRAATEAPDTPHTDNVTITFPRKTLTCIRMIMCKDLGFDAAQENIERDNFPDTLMTKLALMFGNDLEDLCWNGDTTSADPFITINEGIIQLAKRSADTKKLNLAGGSDYKGVIFPAMLRLLAPRYKKDKANMRFFCPYVVEEGYRDQFAGRVTAAGDAMLMDGGLMKYQGIPVLPIPCLDDTDRHITLTHVKNIAYGFRNEIEMDKERRPRRQCFEITGTAKTDVEINRDEALAIAFQY